MSEKQQGTTSLVLGSADIHIATFIRNQTQSTNALIVILNPTSSEIVFEHNADFIRLNFKSKALGKLLLHKTYDTNNKQKFVNFFD